MSKLQNSQLAAVFYGPKDLRVERVPIRQPKADEVLLKVVYCGICGSDLHKYSGGGIKHSGTAPPRDYPEEVLGHELVAHVVQLGEDVANLVEEGSSPLHIGARVVSEAIVYCGKCEACLQGNTNLCHSIGALGGAYPGALASYVNVKHKLLHVLPDNVTNEQAALIEVLATAVHAVERSGIQKGQTCLVTGAGPVGKHTSAAASSSEIVEGCLVVKVLQQKQNAQKCGASVVLNPIKDDVVKACLDATNGAGVDVVFECAGVQAALDVAFKAVRRRGTVMNIAIWEPNNAARLNPTVLVTKEINFTGALAYDNATFASVVRMIADGSIQTDGLITGIIELEDVVEKGIVALKENAEHEIKILVRPSRQAV